MSCYGIRLPCSLLLSLHVDTDGSLQRALHSSTAAITAITIPDLRIDWAVRLDNVCSSMVAEMVASMEVILFCQSLSNGRPIAIVTDRVRGSLSVAFASKLSHLMRQMICSQPRAVKSGGSSGDFFSYGHIGKRQPCECCSQCYFIYLVSSEPSSAVVQCPFFVRVVRSSQVSTFCTTLCFQGSQQTLTHLATLH